MYDQRNQTRMMNDPDGPPPQGAFPVWSKVFTKPTQQTFSDITAHPDARAKNAYIWVFAAGTFSGFGGIADGTEIQACDGEIESLLRKLAAKQSKPQTPVPPPRSKPRFYDNEPRFEIRDPLYRLAAADLTQIDAIGPYTALKIITEIGTDMSRWPTAKPSPPG